MKAMTPLLSALILLASWSDVGYTIYGVNKYRLREANPVWRWAVDKPVVFTLASTAFHVGLIWVFVHFRATWEVFAGCIAVEAFIAWWNVYCIRRLR